MSVLLDCHHWRSTQIHRTSHVSLHSPPSKVTDRLTWHRGLRRGRLLVHDRGASRYHLRVHARHPLTRSHHLPEGVRDHPAEVRLHRHLGQQFQAVVVREAELVWEAHQGQDRVDREITQRARARGVTGGIGAGSIARSPAGAVAHEASVGTGNDADKLRACRACQGILMYHAGGFNMSRISIGRSLMLRGSENSKSKTVQQTLTICSVDNQQMQMNGWLKIFRKPNMRLVITITKT